jgi:predicted  nucleic acid-binding Zn-ribbon protein
MDPIEAIEELARRVERLLTTAREADQRVQAAQAEAAQWKDKAAALEARIAELEVQGKAREERMQTAAERVKTLLAKLPEAI